MEQLDVIQSKIYDIRGQKVMLDRDLAEMYGVEPRALNQAVKRNTDRFPIDFMFQLTDEKRKSKTVIQINMGIMRAFVAVRYCSLLLSPPISPVHELQREVKELKEYIEEVFAYYNDINDDTRMQLELINQTLAELQVQKALADKPRNPIGFITPKKK